MHLHDCCSKFVSRGEFGIVTDIYWFTKIVTAKFHFLFKLMSLKRKVKIFNYSETAHFWAFLRCLNHVQLYDTMFLLSGVDTR